jgi:hypothetical protein
MAPRQMHLHGSAADHAEWAPVEVDDDFDAAGLERAMTEAREQAYRSLAVTDAA